MLTSIAYTVPTANQVIGWLKRAFNLYQKYQKSKQKKQQQQQPYSGGGGGTYAQHSGAGQSPYPPASQGGYQQQQQQQGGWTQPAPAGGKYGAHDGPATVSSKSYVQSRAPFSSPRFRPSMKRNQLPTMVLLLLSPPARLRALGGACLRNPGSLIDRRRKPRQLRSPSLPLSPPSPALPFDPSRTRRVPCSARAKRLDNEIDRLPLPDLRLRFPFYAPSRHRHRSTPLPFDLHRPSTIRPRPRTAPPAPPPQPLLPPPLLMPDTPSFPTCTSSTSYPLTSVRPIAPYYDWSVSTRRRSKRRIRTWPMRRTRTTSLCETRPSRSGISW